MKPIIFKSIITGGIAAFLLSGCSSTSKNAAANQQAEQFPVIALSETDTVLETSYVADIQAVKNVEVRTRVKGFLEKVYVDEGMSVRKGQPLFRINDEEYRVALSRAKAALSSAVAEAKATELEVERVKLLVDKKVISKSELEVANSKLKAVRARIDEAQSSVSVSQARLDYTNIRAPFDGVIDRLPLKAGSLIDEGSLLTTISDVSAMYAYFNFPENEYLRYVKTRKEGEGHSSDEVKLVLSDGSTYAYNGKIETVEGEIDQSTGSIAFRARFPNPEKLLRHGASGQLYVATSVSDVIMVPQKSVFEIQDKNYVYRVDKDNKLRMKSFVPVTRFAQYYVVREGLTPGDKILYEGVQNVRDGMSIRPKMVRADSLVALY